jgi:hypothetical protein
MVKSSPLLGFFKRKGVAFIESVPSEERFFGFSIP